MISNPECAELAYLIQIAMDMHNRQPGNLDPIPDKRIADLGYEYIAPVVGCDYTPDHVLSNHVVYGIVLRKDGVITVANRGTNGLLEWIEDAAFLMVNHPRGGKVEHGFYSVYKTLDIMNLPAAAWLTAQQLPKRIAGHSLAAAFSAYLTLDVPGAVGRFIAQPKIGDDAFVSLFDTKVKDYLTLNYNKDVVPDLPFYDMGYRDLPRTTYFTSADAQAVTDDWNVSCRHSCMAYCARLDYASYAKWSITSTCVEGPNPPLTA